MLWLTQEMFAWLLGVTGGVWSPDGVTEVTGPGSCRPHPLGLSGQGVLCSGQLDSPGSDPMWACGV